LPFDDRQLSPQFARPNGFGVASPVDVFPQAILNHASVRTRAAMTREGLSQKTKMFDYAFLRKIVLLARLA
jgi:hypothetical protein